MLTYCEVISIRALLGIDCHAITHDEKLDQPYCICDNCLKTRANQKHKTQFTELFWADGTYMGFNMSFDPRTQHKDPRQMQWQGLRKRIHNIEKEDLQDFYEAWNKKKNTHVFKQE